MLKIYVLPGMTLWLGDQKVKVILKNEDSVRVRLPDGTEQVVDYRSLTSKKKS